MKNIYFLGECMVELRSTDLGVFNQSFAGDVYNSAVYLKRCFADIKVNLVSAVGQDNLSLRMLNSFAAENIEHKFVFKHPNKVPGLYLIEIDEVGERSFIYWRGDSAARKVVDFLSAQVIDDISASDMLFFSGISLAVVEPSAREQLWLKLAQLKNAGVKLVFDPNYRARLWLNAEQAKHEFERAFNLADIVMPGVEDFDVLYGINHIEEIIEFLRPFAIEEIVIKNGSKSVVSLVQGEQQIHEIIPVTNVVDTTSAGDAFNGAYLGARLNGESVSHAVALAAKAAGTVIQYHGAIVEKTAFTHAMSH